MRKLTKNDVVVSVVALYEPTAIEGNAVCSGDADYDNLFNNQIRKDLNDGNDWAWCSVCVKVTERNTGISRVDHLGCCSYADREDFIKNSGYYDDMVSNCLDELNACFERAYNAYCVA